MLFACVLVLIVTPLSARPADEHAQHHPAGVAGAPATPPLPDDATQPRANGAGTGAGMMESGMMDCGGAACMGRALPNPPLYPSLMELPDLPAERRAQIEKDAHTRMRDAGVELNAAITQTNAAIDRLDLGAMERANARLSEARGKFDTALAAHRALAAGQAPRSIALDWFKREMNLTVDSIDVHSASGPFGLTPAHFVAMVLLIGFVLLAAAMYVARARRLRVLITNLRTGGAAIDLPLAPSAAEPNAPGPAPAPEADRARVPASPTGNWAGKLRVARIFQETPTVKTFRLAPVADTGAPLPFMFEPGQFLTIAVDVDGTQHKRSFSIASSPCCVGWCEVTVKHEIGGIVSGQLHSHVKEGDLLDVSGPYGRFTFRGHEAPSVVFIAGGVGITPLMSSIRYLTDQSWNGRIDLLYGVARLESVIFRDELDQLSRRHPNLHVTLVLSEETSDTWKGARGFITTDLLRDVPDIRSRRIHLCGPPVMMDAVKKALASVGVAEEWVRTELFLSPRPTPAEPLQPSARVAAAAMCSFVRSNKQASMERGRTVLEAAESAGVHIEYVCRQGFCGVCKVKLVSGRVSMAVQDGLTAADRASGLILACQAKADSNISVDA